MRKYWVYVSVGLSFLLTFLINLKGVVAASYNIDLVPYNVTNACDLEADGGEVCYRKYLDGQLNDKLITNNKVENGQNIMVIVQMTPSSDSELISVVMQINANPKLKYYRSSYGPEMGWLTKDIGYEYKIYPEKQSGRYTTKTWVSMVENVDQAVKAGSDQVNLGFDSGADKQPLLKQAPFAALFYTVTDAQPGEEIILEISKLFQDTNAGKDGNIDITGDLILNDLTLFVASNISGDGTLKTLKATGNNTLDYTIADFVPSDKDSLSYILSVHIVLNDICFYGTPNFYSI